MLMMRVAVVSVLLLLCCGMSVCTVTAQERVSVGLGVGLNPSTLFGDRSAVAVLPSGFATLYVPVQVGEYVRIEPEVSFATSSDRKDIMEFGVLREVEFVQTILRMGAGVFYTWRVDSTFRVLLGGRAGILSSFWERNYYQNGQFIRDGGDGEGRGSLYYAFGAGTEYYFSRHASIGAEFMLHHQTVGIPQYRYGVTPPPPTNYHFSSWTTQALVSLRFYF